jgi:ABC-type antimicrobial peptide transport system permease subunit
VTAAIRTSQDPRGVEREARSAIAAQDPDLLVSYVRTMEEQMGASLVRERILAWLSAGFGVLALGLACVGLYGVTAQAVRRRTHEIGVRLALGARPAQVLRQTLREAMLLCGTGLGIGMAATLALAPTFAAFVFDLSARDPAALLASMAALLATSLLAAYVPARRAAAIDPVRALRTE